jgi:cyclopropane fatty-acyl-phospholipid synthase-like methyltransferase
VVQFDEMVQGKDILDIGCGAAGFLERAKTRAKSCAGVELNRIFEDCWTNLGIPVVSDVSELKQQFDIVFLFHTLEHIAEPVDFLRKVKPVLKEGGKLVVEVPSADDALLTLYENEGFQNFTYWSPHLFLYTPRTLQDLMRQAGFVTQVISQFQRYPLSNHLHWLAKGKPGGHQKWSFLDSPELQAAYAAALARVGRCDTLIGWFY